MRRLPLLLLLLGADPARANPIDAFGFGSRAAAMAGAATATSEDSSANYYNPAGLVRGSDLRIDFGYRFAEPYLRMNGHDVGVDATRGFVAGLVAPGALGKFRFAFGAAFSIPDQRLVRIRSVAYQTPRFIYYDNRPQRMFLAANLAIQIIPGLYIGGGVTFLSRTQGEVNLDGNVAYTNPDESSLVSKIDVGLFAVRYPQAGILWDASPNLSFGVSYRHSFTLELSQDFRIDGSIGNPGLPPILPHGYFLTKARVNDLFQPWQLTGSVAARLLRRLLVTFDATFARWSEFPGAYLPVIQLDIGIFNDRVKLSPARDYPRPGFHDIFIPRVGLEWRAHEGNRVAVDVRGGYAYEPSPAPEQINESNLADCDKHTFALGAGVQLSRLGEVLHGSLGLDLHVAATWLPQRLHHKLDPVDAVGDFSSDGVVVQLGVMMRSRF